MHDTSHCLDALKTTYSEMRFSVTEFQRYYLEACGCLDYLELYKLHMDGEKLYVETVSKCVWAFPNITCVTQDFHMSGLPVWLLHPSNPWDTPVQSNILDIVNPVKPIDTFTCSSHFH